MDQFRSERQEEAKDKFDINALAIFLTFGSSPMLTFCNMSFNSFILASRLFAFLFVVLLVI